jgi:hypothetical protein
VSRIRSIAVKEDYRLEALLDINNTLYNMSVKANGNTQFSVQEGVSVIISEDTVHDTFYSGVVYGTFNICNYFAY